MTTINKAIPWVSLLVWLLAMTVWADDTPRRLTLVHVNDVYEIAPREGMGGLAELATLLERERQRAPDLLFTFGGDLLSPSLLSGTTKGSHMIEVFNALKLDVAVPGNHEFDFGPENFAKQITNSQFAWVADNLTKLNGHPFAGMQRGWIKPIGDLTVGVVGLITPSTVWSSKPGDTLQFHDVEVTAAKAVAELRAKGVDVVVALTHLTLAEDRQLAIKVKGIDVILGGHDHNPAAIYENKVLILRSGSDAWFAGVIELEVSRENLNDKSVARVIPSWRMVPIHGLPAQPEVKQLVDKYQNQLDASLGVILAKVAEPFSSSKALVRSQEVGMGNLVADAMREAVGAEIGLMNGGGLRGDRDYPAGYELTARDILKEMPFGNVTLLIAIKGADLREALESSLAQVEEQAGRFPQVAGMTMVYDPTVPPGQRLVEVRVAGQPLAPERMYRLAVTDYLYNGHDGYEPLKRGRLLLDVSAASLTANQVIDSVKVKGVVRAPVEGRIRTK